MIVDIKSVVLSWVPYYLFVMMMVMCGGNLKLMSTCLLSAHRL